MIDEREALAIARNRAAENGWSFPDAVEVVARHGWSGGVQRYEIETNPGMRGTKARFVIDATTGAILSEGYLPR